MSIDQQIVLILADPYEQSSYQWCLMEIKWRVGIFRNQFSSFRFTLFLRQMSKIESLERNTARTVNDLERLPIAGVKAGSQALMTCHDFIQTALDRILVQVPADLQCPGKVI